MTNPPSPRPRGRFQLMLGVAALGHAGSIQVEWMETARFHDGTTALMQERPPLKLEPVEHLPTAHALTIDRSRSYQVRARPVDIPNYLAPTTHHIPHTTSTARGATRRGLVAC